MGTGLRAVLRVMLAFGLATAAVAWLAGPAFGATRLKSYRIVHSHLIRAAAGAVVQGSVDCKAGRVVLGGGVAIGPSTLDTNINSSWPESPTTWSAVVDNASGSTIHFQVWATCAAEPPGYRVVDGLPSDLPPDGGAQALAGCPMTEVALSGGVDVTSGTSGTRIQSLYTGDTPSYFWTALVESSSVLDASVTASVVCADEPKGYGVVDDSQDPVAAGSQGEYFGGCGSERAIGGGFYVANGLGGMAGSYPLGQGWQLVFNNTSESALGLHEYITCD